VAPSTIYQQPSPSSSLLQQLTRTVAIAATSVLLLLLMGWLLLAMVRITLVFLLMGVVAGELLIAALSIRLENRQQESAALTIFVVGTQFFATLAALLLQLPAVSVGVLSLMIIISAFLRGFRYATVVAIIGMLMVSILIILLSFPPLALASFLLINDAGTIIRSILQIVFLVAIIGVTVVLTMHASDRLRSSLVAAEQRAHDAEQAQAQARAISEQLTVQVAEQSRLLVLIQQLEVPLIPLFEGVLVLPLVGNLDSQRCAQIEQALLEYISSTRTKLVLADISAVPTVDTAIASQLVQMGQAVRLLGSTMVLTGIKPAVAQTIVALGIERLGMRSYASIEDALNTHLPRHSMA
jgi:anti-anti-sigma regulatory factor